MGVEVKVSPLFTPGEVKLPPLPSLGGGGMKLSLPRASVHTRVAGLTAQLMRPPCRPTQARLCWLGAA